MRRAIICSRCCGSRPVVPAPGSSASPIDAAHGAALYKRYCRGCHGEDGRGGGPTHFCYWWAPLVEQLR